MARVYVFSLLENSVTDPPPCYTLLAYARRPPKNEGGEIWGLAHPLLLWVFRLVIEQFAAPPFEEGIRYGFSFRKGAQKASFWGLPKRISFLPFFPIFFQEKVTVALKKDAFRV